MLNNVFEFVIRFFLNGGIHEKNFISDIYCIGDVFLRF